MTRRAFLIAAVGVFAAGALPAAIAGRRTVRAPAWWKGPVLLFTCDPLPPGNHTFSAGSEYGVCVSAVIAVGGETAFEVPWGCNAALVNPLLSDGIYFNIKDGLLRGIYSNPRKVRQA